MAKVERVAARTQRRRIKHCLRHRQSLYVNRFSPDDSPPPSERITINPNRVIEVGLFALTFALALSVPVTILAFPEATGRFAHGVVLAESLATIVSALSAVGWSAIHHWEDLYITKPNGQK